MLDEDVVADAVAGRPAALTAVYQALAPTVRGYLLARGSEDPDGLTNEVFVQVIPRLPHLHGGESGLRALVFSVAHARLVDELRRRSRRPQLTAYDASADRRRVVSAEDEVTGDAALIALLDDLTPEQRDVLVLRVVADLSVEQTAQVLERTPGSVKQLHRRALASLRARVETGRGVREVSGDEH